MFLSKPVGPLPIPIVPPLPEVYQIETVHGCNMSCIMCPVQFFKREDKRTFLEIDLLKKIINQGDFDASYFIEFQISGEPLLHPKLGKIIDLVKETGVMTGLSTNGILINKQTEALLKLDVITISLDSITNHDKIRVSKSKPFSITKLLKDIKDFLPKAADKGITVDVQIVELDGWEEQFKLITEEFSGHACNIRTNPNCYHAFIHKDIPLPVSTDFCINPWFSASIMCSGNVTPCCMSLGDDIVYGNLYNNTLREVWAGEEVKKVRLEMQNNEYREVCQRCYMRGAALFHWNMYMSELKKRYKNHRIPERS